jgi:aryl-alcohol dehydrogenase-like predicted oxidoreductase
MQDGDWPEQMKGPLDALSEAKEKGLIRAGGCSCHSVGALEAAAAEPGVEVCLARINPFAVRIDVEKPQEVPQVEKALAALHERQKGVYAMKVLGEGRLKGERIDASLRFVLSRPFLSGFTIGFGRDMQIDDIIRRVDAIRMAAQAAA